MDPVTIAAALAVPIAALAGHLSARRTGREANAVTGFSALTEALERRVARLEAADERRRVLAVAHVTWDRDAESMVSRLGGHISPPPPLD
jgi:hypothetical protein